MAKWFNSSGRAEHFLFGRIEVTHRSDHGHVRAIVKQTGQEIEVCLENIVFDKTEPMPRLSKLARQNQRIQRIFPNAEIDELLRKIFSDLEGC